MAGAELTSQQPLFATHARALFENMAEGLVICEAIRDAEGHVTDYWIREANAVYLKRAPEGAGAVGRRMLDMRPATSARWFAQCEAALNGEEVRFEFQDPLSGRWYDAHMTALSADSFSQFFMDISHRKAAEARQRGLFDELNHRVKNNLAIVSAMLEQQARAASPDVRGHLEQAVGRVRSIAELHNMLYQQNRSGDVDLHGYLEALCAHVRGALSARGEVRLDLRCDTIAAAIGEAVSLGLIVNELVTNCAKHAFPAGQAGRVEVDVAAVGGGLRLRVCDDGVGLSSQPEVGDSLGLRMVKVLARNLRATVEVLPGPGTAIEIHVPRLGRLL